MFKLMKLTMTAGAAVLLVAACGGGSGGGSGGVVPPASVTPSVQLSGTAAVGLALSNSPVQVKCSTGAGSTTTLADGTYAINLEGAVLPCIVQVVGTVGEATVTLHSVAEAGTVTGSNTAAVANVTPLSEMVVAQATGTLPSDLFTGFTATSAQQLTTAQLNTAINAIITALTDATGIDLSLIGDPLKAPLVAATSTNTSGGNEFDKLLDELGTKVSVETIPTLVNQIAVATTSSDPAAGLTDVVTAVSAGSLAGCPSALSGKYRMLNYYGRTVVRNFDFGAGTMTNTAGLPVYTVTVDSSKPCTFVSTRSEGGAVVDEFQFAMGPAGAGVYRGVTYNTDGTTSSSIGYLFPVQSHPYSVIQGEWTTLESGYFGSSFEHEAGKVTFTADRKAPYCEYEGNPLVCVPDPESDATVQDRTDGGFDVVDTGELPFQVFAYRTPAGAVTIFGTFNPAGTNMPAQGQTHLVGGKITALSLPAVGSVGKFNEFGFRRGNGSGPAFNFTDPIVTGTNTIISVDTAANSVVRRNQAGREDTQFYNNPIPGARFRPAGTFPNPAGGSFTFAAANNVTWPGIGITATFNSQPPALNGFGHFFSLSANRP
jgi:hypothetical protein